MLHTKHFDGFSLITAVSSTRVKVSVRVRRSHVLTAVDQSNEMHVLFIRYPSELFIISYIACGCQLYIMNVCALSFYYFLLDGKDEEWFSVVISNIISVLTAMFFFNCNINR